MKFFFYISKLLTFLRRFRWPIPFFRKKKFGKNARFESKGTFVRNPDILSMFLTKGIAEKSEGAVTVFARNTNRT